jgi:hypothetical protein
MLAYHDEHDVQSWSEEADEDLMADLMAVHDRLNASRSLGPAARLGATSLAVTIRGKGLVVDGPFAETKEALLGFYILDVPDLEAAIAAAQDFKAANPGAIYELRPIVLYTPGAEIPWTDAGLDLVRPAKDQPA